MLNFSVVRKLCVQFVISILRSDEVNNNGYRMENNVQLLSDETTNDVNEM